MKMQRKQFRIGELSKTLEVERFVIRFWEKEFNVTGNRSQGGQRFYEEKDLERFRSIKTLLYEQGFTIAGAKKQFKKNDHIFGSHRTVLEDTPKKLEPSFINKLKSLRDKLLDLHAILEK